MIWLSSHARRSSSPLNYGSSRSCVLDAAAARAGVIPVVRESEATNRSGSEAFVPVVQSTDLWERDDLAVFWQMDRPSVGAIFVQ
jgi:hypothetical protein